MEFKIEKKSTDASKRIASIVSEVISHVGNVVSASDLQKKAKLEFARRDVINIASAQIQKMKDVAKLEIEKINDRAAAERKAISDKDTTERKVINDKAVAERKIVKDKLNVNLKRFNDEVDAEIGKIDDILFSRRISRVAKIDKVAMTSVADSSPVWGVPKDKNSIF